MACIHTVCSAPLSLTISRTLSLISVSQGSATDTMVATLRKYCNRSFWKRSIEFCKRQHRDSKPRNSSRNLSPLPSHSASRSRVNCRSRSDWRQRLSSSCACVCTDSNCCCIRCFSVQAVVRMFTSSASQLCSVSLVVVSLVRIRCSSATISAAFETTRSGVKLPVSHTSMPKHRHKRRTKSCNCALLVRDKMNIRQSPDLMLMVRSIQFRGGRKAKVTSSVHGASPRRRDRIPDVEHVRLALYFCRPRICAHAATFAWCCPNASVNFVHVARRRANVIATMLSTLTVGPIGCAAFRIPCHGHTANFSPRIFRAAGDRVYSWTLPIHCAVWSSGPANAWDDDQGMAGHRLSAKTEQKKTKLIKTNNIMCVRVHSSSIPLTWLILWCDKCNVRGDDVKWWWWPRTGEWCTTRVGE